MNSHAISRRRFLGASAALAASAMVVGAKETDAPATTMGLAGDGWTIHRKSGRDADPLSFLQTSHEMKMGGIQCALNFKNPDDVKKLRSQAEQWGMYVEASIPLITGSADRFDHNLQVAKEAGISVIRTVLFPGRRYEALQTHQQFVDATKHAIETLKWAEPIVAKNGMILAIENHKDQRIDERIAMMKQFDSEHVGICVDVGNSFALCEDSLETVKAYAPWARAVHIKDQAAAECPEGFLYADEALGQGALDLPAMVDLLRAARPNVRFSLEVITRNPLLVPVLTSKYWATMPDVPASDLAKTFAAVKQQKRLSFPNVASMTLDQQLAMETQIVRKSIEYAVAKLKLAA
jgi:sugar phosphate isomerase/epimerase